MNKEIDNIIRKLLFTENIGSALQFSILMH
ncbi:hypothetical protein GTW31_23120 [Vibrio parahaemolyticus]|nr:hypothetical protein [Vibrio parahaemolyticus]